MIRFEAEVGAEGIKTTLGLKRKPKTPQFKESKEDGRIYPGYFAPVIVFEEGKRIIKPMRYRVRPRGSSEEIPSKYNVFNARIDSLESRRTWKGLFMKNHGLFPFVRFYEWVERGGKKTLIKFNPGEREIMWAPVLFDSWESKDGKVKFESFALLTDDPPPEVEEQGHDRCPIFLRENLINDWLNPENKSNEDVYNLLKDLEDVYFQFALAA